MLVGNEVLELSEYRVYDIHLRKYKNKNMIVPLYSPINLSNLTVDFIIGSLRMEPIAFIGVKRPHPLVYSEGGKTIHPYTIYFSPQNSLLALKVVGEFSFKESLEEFPKIADALLEWAEINEVRKVIAVDYVPPIDDAKRVFFVTEDYLVSELIELGLKPYSGIFGSEAAYLLDECMRRRIDGILLMVESEAYKVLGGLIERIATRTVDRETVRRVLTSLRFDAGAVSRALDAIARITGVTFNLAELERLSQSFEEACKKSLELLARSRRIGAFM